MIGWVLLFFIAGMCMILAEFLLPGGVLGMLGALLVLTSAALGVYAYPEQAVLIIFGELTGAALSVILGFWVLTRTRALKLLTLQTSQRAEDGFVSAVSDLSLVGREGVAVTALRPSGVIRVGDERLDAVTDGGFVEEGRPVRVLEVHGSRIVVEAVDSH